VKVDAAIFDVLGAAAGARRLEDPAHELRAG
jgi:hypothetical protein